MARKNLDRKVHPSWTTLAFAAKLIGPAEFASQAGCSEAYVNRFESGYARMAPKSKIALAMAIIACESFK